MANGDTKILIDHIYKVFGPNPQSVMDMIRDGADKQQVLEQTGHVIGIRDVSLEIKAGETFVVMGLSGSGKSTLIRHINRLIEPTAGRILVDGEDVLELNAAGLRELRRHKVSMVFQRFGLLPHQTVLDNVIYGLLVAGVDKRAARDKGMEQIELVGLAGFENQYPKQLSGGMQQRVGLARALATDAEVMLMDEAFSALDPLIRNDMQGQLKDLQARLHKTIVFITHDLDEALRLGDHIAILKDGELRQVGTGEEILLHPADDYVRRFVRDVNRARVVTVGSMADSVAVLEANAITPESCGELLSKHGAIVLTANGVPERVIGRDWLQKHGGTSAVGNGTVLPAAVCVDQHATIEESLDAISTSDGPVVVLDDTSRPIGAVDRDGVLKAIVRI